MWLKCKRHNYCGYLKNITRKNYRMCNRIATHDQINNRDPPTVAGCHFPFHSCDHNKKSINHILNSLPGKKQQTRRSPWKALRKRLGLKKLAFPQQLSFSMLKFRKWDFGIWTLLVFLRVNAVLVRQDQHFLLPNRCKAAHTETQWGQHGHVTHIC